MSKSSRNWALGALIAGAAGYVAGLLTAPKSGRETREDIMHAANRAKTDAEKSLKSLHSQLNDLLDDAKVRQSDLRGKARDELDSAMKGAEKAKQKARDILSALHDGDADDPELKEAVDNAKAAIDHLKRFLSKSS